MIECFCKSIPWDPAKSTEPFSASCECQYRDDVRLVNLGGAGLMLVSK